MLARFFIRDVRFQSADAGVWGGMGMTINRLWVGRPSALRGNMPCFASWRYANGYWRWALYWSREERGFGFRRARSLTGNFGCYVATPFGTIRLATQPPWSRSRQRPEETKR